MLPRLEITPSVPTKVEGKLVSLSTTARSSFIMYLEYIYVPVAMSEPAEVALG